MELTNISSCHGGAIFPGIIDPSTKKSIIDSRRVTGFTTRGEEEENVLDTIKSWNRPTIEATAASCGATCSFPSCLVCPISTDHYRCLSQRTMGRIYYYGWAHCDRRQSCQCACHCRRRCDGFWQALDKERKLVTDQQKNSEDMSFLAKEKSSISASLSAVFKSRMDVVLNNSFN